ncbi:MAG: DUF3786 domain-containing protein [Deltaproteobacteria bacterium]|nr:DUF3786 domain-containing protein [Deltaproteobacteria bacterium]
MPRIDDYRNALALAREDWAKQDPRRAAVLSGAEYQPGTGEGRLQFRFIDKVVQVTWPAGLILGPDPEKDLPLQEQVLILHYLQKAPGAPLTGQWITFREIPSGEFYYSAFVKRAKEPLVKTFGHQPQLLKELGLQRGGLLREEGDVCICFQAFPKIPVCLILWAGDEEFPPDGNVLFDASIVHYLIAEDVAVLSGMVVYPLIGMAYQKK